MFICVHFDPKLWTVGRYDADGKFQPHSNYDNREEAVRRTAYLNGGGRPIASESTEAAYFAALSRIAAGICAGNMDFGFPPPSPQIAAQRIADMTFAIAEEFQRRIGNGHSVSPACARTAIDYADE